MRIPRTRAGFTLVELIVVVAILVVLAGVLVPAIGGYVDKAKASRAQSDMKEIGNAFVRYQADTGIWPSNATYTSINTTSANLANFRCMYQNTFNRTGWDGPYLNRGQLVGTVMQVATTAGADAGLIDPWGQAYVIYYFANGYLAAGSPGSIVLLCRGPNGTNDTPTGAALAMGTPAGDDKAYVVTLKL